MNRQFAVLFLILCLMSVSCTQLFEEIPEELKTPRIATGSGWLEKKVVFENWTSSTTSEILVRKNPQGIVTEIVVAGISGCSFLEKDFRAKKTVTFDKTTTRTQVLDVDGDGQMEFVNRGGDGWQDASLLDQNGKTLWTYGGMPGVDDMCGGDLDGDGKAEFVVSFNGDGGVHLLNKNGKKEWQEPGGNVWQVQITDIEGDGKAETIENNSMDYIVRDRSGKILRQNHITAFSTHFSICHWPGKADPKYILTSCDDWFWVLDFDAKPKTKLKSPLPVRGGGGVWGIPVKFNAQEPEYFAVLENYSLFSRSQLCVYSAAGDLVYHEILPEKCAGIVAFPTEGSVTETLLIGGDGKVWQYAKPALAK